MTLESEERIFTEYVRAMIEGGRPDDLLGRVLDRLRLWLRWELQKRGVWNKPPYFLGIGGYGHWFGGGSSSSHEASAGQTLDALHELTQIAYMDLFLNEKRLARFGSYVRNSRKIEGAVRTRLRQLIHERQNQHGFHPILRSKLYGWQWPAKKASKL